MSSETWPLSGMTRSGMLYRLPRLALPTYGNVSLLLPTPTAVSYGTNIGGGAGRVGKVKPSLETMARHNLWPTPTPSDEVGGPGTSPKRKGGKNLRTAVNGQLNPTWVEWLMGFPEGWTALEPSETP
jgi:hypothetical protein